VRATARLVDVLPTLLERLRLAVPAHVQGRSLLPLVAAAERGPRFVFSEWRLTEQRALREGDWKYVRRGWREELYDLALDPGEQRNVAWRNRHVTARLRRDAERLASASEALHASAGSGSRFGLDEETREELQALGYLVEGQGN
jgi:arylsulfatase A-like enzyme